MDRYSPFSMYSSGPFHSQIVRKHCAGCLGASFEVFSLSVSSEMAPEPRLFPARWVLGMSSSFIDVLLELTWDVFEFRLRGSISSYVSEDSPFPFDSRTFSDLRPGMGALRFNLRLLYRRYCIRVLRCGRFVLHPYGFCLFCGVSEG